MFLLVCAAVSCAQGQDVYQWFGAVSSNWEDGGNWYNEFSVDPIILGQWGYVPDPHGKVKINNPLWGNTFFPVIGGENGTQDIPIGDIFMVDAGYQSPAYLTVATGGSLLVQGATDNPGDAQINIAYAALGTASLIIDGGVVTVDGVVHVGWGGNGEMVLNSGTITVNAVDFGGVGGSGLISITEGVLELRGYWVDEMTGFANDGLIVGYGDSNNILISWNPITEITIVTAIPEPPPPSYSAGWISVGPNDFKLPVPKPLPKMPGTNDVNLAAQIWVGVRCPKWTAPPPTQDPNGNTVVEPNSVKVEAFIDPNKSWNSDKNDPNLMRHEQGHVNIAEDAARKAQAEINKKIKNKTLKGVGKDPNEAIADLNKNIQEIIDKEKESEKQENYDKETYQGFIEEEQKKALDEQEEKLEQPNKDPNQKTGPDAESASNNSCTYNPGLGLAFENNIIVSVPDPLDPVIGAEFIMPVFKLAGQTADGEFWFQAEAAASTIEIRKDNQTYLSVGMDYMLYSPAENMFYGLGMAFQSDIPEGISAYIDGVCQALTSKNTLTLYGVEIHPEADFMVLTDGFTTPGDCPTLNTSGMRIVGLVPQNCAEVWTYGYGLKADLNRDCRVDFRDFATFSSYWLNCNDPYDTNCLP